MLEKSWAYVKRDDFTIKGHEQMVEVIKNHALNLAIEAVQIAAVAQKYIDTLEEVK